MKFRSLISLALIVVLAPAARGAEWPHWRGPGRDGIAPAAKFHPEAVGRGEILWSKSIGIGYGTVAVRDGRAYVSGWRDGQDIVWCFDAETGQRQWRFAYDNKQYAKQHKGGPSSTPAIDAGRLYHFSRDGRLFCLKVENGERVWTKDLRETHGVNMPNWAFSGSPLVKGDRVVIDAGKIIAFDKRTGTEIWATKNYGSAYSTPTPFTLDGRELLATFPKHGLVVLREEDGAEIATHRWKTRFGVNAATPIVQGDRIFISSGYGRGGSVLELQEGALKTVWENRRMRNQIPTCVLLDGYLYGFDAQRLKCIRFSDGEQMWQKGGYGQGSLIAAGKTLIVLGAKGNLIAAEATPEGFSRIGKTSLFDEGRTWAGPTIAEGRIYCRSPGGKLVCLDAGNP